MRISIDAATAFISIGLNALPHLISLFLCPIPALNMQMVCTTGAFFQLSFYSVPSCFVLTYTQIIRCIQQVAAVLLSPPSAIFSLPSLQLSVSRCDSQCCSFNTRSCSRVFST